MIEGQFTLVATGSGSGNLGGARINQVSPSPPISYPGHNNILGSVTQAWVGGSVDQQRGEYILCANGGHADYAGNEAYALALRASTPAWRRLTDPTPSNQLGDLTNEGATYADGRYRAMHHCFQCFGDGRVWTPLMNSVASGGGGAFNRSCSFNRNDTRIPAASPLAWTGADTGPYAIHQAIPGFGDLTSLIFGTAVHDRYGHKAYGFAGNSSNYRWWTVDTIGPTLGTVNFFEAGGDTGLFGGWAVCAHDLRIMVLSEHFSNTFRVLDLRTNTWTRITNTTGPQYHAFSGGAYHARSRQIIIGDPPNLGRQIYVLRIPTTTVNGRTVYNPSGQWVWTTTTPAGPTIPLNGGNQNVYTKWAIVDDVGDGRSAVVYAGDIANGTAILCVPNAGF